MNTKVLVGIVLVLVLGGWYMSSQGGTDTAMEKESDAMMQDHEGAQDVISLTPVGTYSGDGDATRSYDGSVFLHTVTARVDDPAEGKFYEGWLVMKEPTLTFISTGELTKENGAYTLTFESDTDYSEYVDVVITEETSANGLDGTPEAHVLEGTFLDATL